MTRALVSVAVLSLILCACGSDEEGQDLSGAASDLAGVGDQAVNLDMLPPRTFRVNVIASSASLLQTVSYGPTCARLFFGPCEAVVCPAGTSSGWSGSEARSHAGVITATSGTASLSITPSATGNYGGGNGGPLALDVATPVTVTAAGGDVPMFSAMLTAPSATALAQGLPASMSRAADAQLTFAPIADAEVIISFSQPSSTVVCFFPGATGQGTIPSAALGQLAPTPTTYGIYTVHRQEIMAGNFGVQVRVARQIPSSNTVTLQ